MIELKYIIWKTKTFIGLDSQNWDNRVKNQWLWIYIKRKNTMWRRLENNEKCKQNLKHLENYVKLCNACVIRVLERNEVENKVEKIWKKAYHTINNGYLCRKNWISRAEELLLSILWHSNVAKKWAMFFVTLFIFMLVNWVFFQLSVVLFFEKNLKQIYLNTFSLLLSL